MQTDCSTITDIQFGHNIEEAQCHVAVRSCLRATRGEESQLKRLSGAMRSKLSGMSYNGIFLRILRIVCYTIGQYSLTRRRPAHPRGGGCKARGTARWRGGANSVSFDDSTKYMSRSVHLLRNVPERTRHATSGDRQQCAEPILPQWIRGNIQQLLS